MPLWLAAFYWQLLITTIETPVGPAGALARYFNILGWTLDKEGVLSLDAYLHVSIRSDSIQAIRAVVRQS